MLELRYKEIFNKLAAALEEVIDVYADDGIIPRLKCEIKNDKILINCAVTSKNNVLIAEINCFISPVYDGIQFEVKYVFEDSSTLYNAVENHYDEYELAMDIIKYIDQNVQF